MDEFAKTDQKINTIKSKISELKNWLNDISLYIKPEIAKGILNVEGKKITSRLNPHVEGNLKKIYQFLYELMKTKAGDL